MKLLLLFVLFIVGVYGRSTLREMELEMILRPLSLGCKKAVDMKCPREDITFWLYTRETQRNPTKLDQYNLELLKYAPFVDAPLKFIVHGYSVDKDTAVNAFLRPAYFAHGEYNIISVDWSPLGKSPCYYQAAMNVPTISHCVAQFFNGVLRARNFSSVHLLGHSMGAHISAQASLEIPNLERFTSFDPANPLYHDGSKLLVTGVAKFMDVYHSNSGLKGRQSPSGHADIYYNNEVYQPGCNCGAVFTTCSHDRAVEVYAESIVNRGRMVAFRCGGFKDYSLDKCPIPASFELVTVGEDIKRDTRGRYLMFTNGKTPFLIEQAMYTNPVTFKTFKKTAGNKCKIAHDLLSIVKNW